MHDGWGLEEALVFISVIVVTFEECNCVVHAGNSEGPINHLDGRVLAARTWLGTVPEDGIEFRCFHRLNPWDSTPEIRK